MKYDKLYLIHIHECIKRIEIYIERVWKIIERELTGLNRAIKAMIREPG